MTEFMTYVQELLGSPPVGYEPLQYVIAGSLLVILCMSAVNLVSGIFRWIGGM